MIEHWSALKYYYSLADFETHSSKEKLNFISTYLNNATKFYFYFLSYALGMINKLNLEMQAEDVRIHVIVPRVKHLFKQFCRNFMSRNVIDRKDIYRANLNENHLPLENVFCGDLVESFYIENSINNEDLIEFKENAKKFVLCNILFQKPQFLDHLISF